MKPTYLKKLAIKVLDQNKAVNIVELDVRKLTDVMDFMVICSATSNRHAKTLAEKIVEGARAKGIRPYGLEGIEQGEWVLIDLNDVVIHIMLEEIREFYNLEKLWNFTKKMKTVEE